MKPQISIIIPLYNCEKTLKFCLDAIKNLDYKNYEVILVNDCSTDKTLKIAQEFKFKIINLKQNLGAANARNIGAEQAKGNILLFTDSDIVLPSDTLNKVESYYKSGNKIFIGRFSPKLRFKNIFSQYKHLYLCYYYSKQDKYLHTLDTSLTVIPRKTFLEFGGFKNQLRISEDAELGTRLTRAGELITQSNELEMEHIRHYSLQGFIQTDFIRGKRFSRLFLSSLFKDKEQRREGKKAKSFFLKPITLYLSVGIMPFLLLALIFFLIFRNLLSFYIFFFFILLFVSFNLEFWHYLAKHNGELFAIKSLFITILDMIVFDIGIGVTFLKFLSYGKKILK